MKDKRPLIGRKYFAEAVGLGIGIIILVVMYYGFFHGWWGLPIEGEQFRQRHIQK